MTNNSSIKSLDCEKSVINRTQMHKQRLKLGLQPRVETRGRLFLVVTISPKIFNLKRIKRE